MHEMGPTSVRVAGAPEVGVIGCDGPVSSIMIMLVSSLPARHYSVLPAYSCHAHHWSQSILCPSWSTSSPNLFHTPSGPCNTSQYWLSAHEQKAAAATKQMHHHTHCCTSCIVRTCSQAQRWLMTMSARGMMPASFRVLFSSISCSSLPYLEVRLYSWPCTSMM